MSFKSHIPFWKKLLRAILGLLLSIGFGLFWVSLIFGIGRFTQFFVLGVITIIIGALHLYFVIKKQVRYYY